MSKKFSVLNKARTWIHNDQMKCPRVASDLREGIYFINKGSHKKKDSSEFKSWTRPFDFHYSSVSSNLRHNITNRKTCNQTAQMVNILRIKDKHIFDYLKSNIK